MTRAEWYVFYREQRLKKNTTSILTLKTINRMLRGVYNYMYEPKQYVFITLLQKYKNKLPRHLAAKKLRLIHSWRSTARFRAKSVMLGLVYDYNPLLSLIPRSDNGGKYLAIPITYYEK